MQKDKNIGSILIWSIFLSIIVASIFISISVEINKSIRNNNYIIENLKNIDQINSKIKGNELNNEILNNNEKLIFDKNDYLNISLKNNEKKIFKYNGTSNFSIEINILKGSPIYFSFLSYSGADNASRNITNSGIIDYNLSFTGYLDNNNDFGNLEIINLGGYSNIDIISEKEFETNEIKYKIIKDFGNKQIEKTSGIITK